MNPGDDIIYVIRFHLIFEGEKVEPEVFNLHIQNYNAMLKQFIDDLNRFRMMRIF